MCCVSTPQIADGRFQKIFTEFRTCFEKRANCLVAEAAQNATRQHRDGVGDRSIKSRFATNGIAR